MNNLAIMSAVRQICCLQYFYLETISLTQSHQTALRRESIDTLGHMFLHTLCTHAQLCGSVNIFHKTDLLGRLEAVIGTYSVFPVFGVKALNCA